MTKNRFSKYIKKYYSDEGRYVGSNLKDLLKNLIILVLLGLTIYLYFRNYSLGRRLSTYEPKTNPTSVSVVTKTQKANSSKEVEQETKIQTTEDSFKKIPKYGQTLMPTKIIYWGSKDIKSGSSKLGFNTIEDRSNRSTSVSSYDTLKVRELLPKDYYFRDFISTELDAFSPTKDSIVQIIFDRKNVRFTSYNQAAKIFQSKDYPVDFERYKYNWTPEGLTRNKIRQLYVQPFTSVKYGVLTKSFSITPGISFKTKRLDYNIGFSINRDTRLNSNIYTDVELQITYKFGKWLE